MPSVHAKENSTSEVAEAARFSPLNAYVQRWVGSTEVDTALGRVRAKRLPSDFHFLVSRTDGSVIETALAFLVNKFTLRMRGPEIKRKRSFLSLVASAYDLKDLTDFLDAQKCTFSDLSTELLNTYVASMTEVRSPVTGRPYADQTIIRRVSTAKSFCNWAQDEGLLRYRFDSERVDVVLDHGFEEARRVIVRFAGDVEQPPQPDRTLHVNVLHPREAPVLLRELGPLPPLPFFKKSKKAARDDRPVRNRLMTECGIQVGMRRAEVVGMTLAALRGCRTKNASAPTHMCLIEVQGKYNRKRKVNIPLWLVDSLKYYVETERVAAVEVGRCRSPAYEEPFTVFVNHAHSIKAPGEAVTVETFNEVFHQAQIRAGLGFDEEVLDVATNKPKQVVSVPHVVHDLRHTYAVWTYWLRKRAGDQEPWKYIQAQLGHRHLSTTTDIYLRAASLFEAQVSDIYVNELRRQIYG